MRGFKSLTGSQGECNSTVECYLARVEVRVQIPSLAPIQIQKKENNNGTQNDFS